MSKTFHKKLHKHKEEEHEDYYGHVRHNFNKSKKKRFDRALKTIDLDVLMDEDLVDFGDEWEN